MVLHSLRTGLALVAATMVLGTAAAAQTPGMGSATMAEPMSASDMRQIKHCKAMLPVEMAKSARCKKMKELHPGSFAPAANENSH